jgi:hypothetical protein
MLALLPFVLALVVPTFGVQTTSVVSKFMMTFYGFPDNDPSGTNLAHDCGRGPFAAGDGSYANPLSLAMFAGIGTFNPCEIVYSPYLKKYLRLEDDCASCTDPATGLGDPGWLDVWMGSYTVDGGARLLACYDTFTDTAQHNHNVIRFAAGTQPDGSLPNVGKKHT